jgi:hypothetical protein
VRCDVTGLRISSDCWTESSQNKIKTIIKNVTSDGSPDTKIKMKPAIAHSLRLKTKPVEKCRQWFVLQCAIWLTEIFNHLSKTKSKGGCKDSINKKSGLNTAGNEDANAHSIRQNNGSVEWPELPTPGIKRKMHSSR